MPVYRVETPRAGYPVAVERGSLSALSEHIPGPCGSVFFVSTAEVWELHGEQAASALGGRPRHALFFAGGEPRKRLAAVEALAEAMIERGADRSSAIVALGGGIVTDIGGFLAAIFMRGVPVIHAPTTLLAQVDAAIGGKTGVNLDGGKNLVGSFHQPVAVLVDPSVLSTLPEREYRAGLFEVVKHGVIASEGLFQTMRDETRRVLAQEPGVVDWMICESVRIKAGVVSGDEKEEGRRRILNFGHTFGHALEAETGYARFLHGEAVAWGMRAAAILARMEGLLSSADETAIAECVGAYGPLPPLDGLRAGALAARLKSDKKTVQGEVHFVLPARIGEVRIVSGVRESRVLDAIEEALSC